MDYQETLAHIFSRGRFGIKPGLERVRLLLRRLGDPHQQLRVIHIAGTNGKGSTAAFLASILRCGGVRAGLFTSPHLVSFTERFRIDGAEITQDAVVAVAQRVLEAAPPEATFFELVTAMAYLHFAEQSVEAAVIEAGMGGGADATNVADGVLSVITPISIDHAEYLGNTLAAIAGEKAGIIKPGRPVVAAAQQPEALEVIERSCLASASSCYRFGDDFAASWDGSSLGYRGLSASLQGLIPGIGGRYQSGNAACALAAAEILGGIGFPLDEEALRSGIEHASWPGRMELFLREGVRVLLDGAHNPAGAEALAESLTYIPRRRLFLVTGVMGDKDAELIAPILPLAYEVYAVAPALERALPSAGLAALCRSRGANCRNAGGVSEGLDQACRAASPDDLVLVCGSLFTVGEARASLTGAKFQPIRG
ncbi:folylpolyglutamate synthase/dihydrofolate synthase family protein [Geobacter sp. DSM 9736]|uniref:bifunctional folylpolyglutamate synthase/dihydrofolate synthase n=1 Tax=Geobacter sp. DSM 9736 TaxID=1277350 RepID=UPI000B51166F|nr:folylpolyglutamate synthase/dihydrofolate synthase family protein [Geobacter sp. DSM 9736]SNB44660.1 dihydrofolate synthase / folylpolyglutamate synthase [Geobacter sp. DSM 9736]